MGEFVGLPEAINSRVSRFFGVFSKHFPPHVLAAAINESNKFLSHI
jgi:hypothetical protein